MPFIGVRISWLMFARNSLFALLAASAANLRAASFSSLDWITAVCWRTRRRRIQIQIDESNAMPVNEAATAMVRSRVIQEASRNTRTSDGPRRRI